MQSIKKKGPLSTIGFLSLILLTTQLFAQVSPTVNMQLRSRLQFAGQDGSNICGYAANGREYALVGTSGGCMIVDVTNPDAPKLIRKIPAVKSDWREIKVYRNFAYIATEGAGQGIQIVNLSRLPDSAGVTFKNFLSDTARGLSNLNRTHALHIDTAKGFCYLYGGDHRFTSGVIVEGATILDIKTDPWNPRYVGNYNQRYIHDGYVENDTLYAGHINQGNFSIIDFRNKANPITLSTMRTPNAATHNTWLTADHKTLLTTDETCSSYLGSYDITNPRQPRLLDKIRTISQENAVIHNVHVVNDYAVTSWYTEGIVVTDVHRPQNIVHVGQYDSYEGLATNYEGAWGVYPFLPSGNILISNITPGELVVVTPQYKRACYLEGTITDAATNGVLSGVRVKIGSTDMDKRAESALSGAYATGQVTAGSFSVTYSKKGYISQTVTVNLATAQVTTRNIALTPVRTFSASGTLTATTDGAVLPNVQLLFKSELEELTVLTNAQGVFSTNLSEGEYAIYAGDWGVSSRFIGKRTINANVSNLSVQLQRHFQDDFWGDFGWQIAGNSAGAWTRGTPISTVINGVVVQPNADSPSDNDGLCFFTGNPSCESGANNSVIGVTYLMSPTMKLRTFSDPQLTFNYWFYNGGGLMPANDTFKVLLSNGLSEVEIWINGQSASAWRQSPALKLKNYLPITDSMNVTFKLADSAPNLNITEGAVDNFRLTDGPPPNTVQNTSADWLLKAFPNPFNAALNIDYQLDKNVKNATINVLNALGQVVAVQKLFYTEGSLSVGLGWPTGVYFVKIEAENQVSKVLRVVKQ